MWYWNEIINNLVKILKKYERVAGKNFVFPVRYYAKEVLRLDSTIIQSYYKINRQFQCCIETKLLIIQSKYLKNMKECLEKIFVFPVRYYANCVTNTLTVLIQHNVESVCCECCVLSGRRLCDGLIQSSRGVLPTVTRRFVWSRDLEN
jgi:hypothetical protein